MKGCSSRDWISDEVCPPQVALAPPHRQRPKVRVSSGDGDPVLVDCLIQMLRNCDAGIQICVRDSVVEKLRETKAQLLTLAVSVYYGSSRLRLRHHPVDNDAIVVVDLLGKFGPDYRGQLCRSEFGPAALPTVIRLTTRQAYQNDGN